MGWQRAGRVRYCCNRPSKQDQNRHPLHRATATTAACTTTRESVCVAAYRPLMMACLEVPARWRRRGAWEAGGRVQGDRGEASALPAQLAGRQPRLDAGCAGSKVVAPTSPSSKSRCGESQLATVSQHARVYLPPAAGATRRLSS